MSVSPWTPEPTSAYTPATPQSSVTKERKPLPESYPTPPSPSPLPSAVIVVAESPWSTLSGQLPGAYPLTPRSLSPTPSASNREPQNEEDSKAQESKGEDRLDLYNSIYPKLDMSSYLTDTEASSTKSSPNMIEIFERNSNGESISSIKTAILALVGSNFG